MGIKKKIRKDILKRLLLDEELEFSHSILISLLQILGITAQGKLSKLGVYLLHNSKKQFGENVRSNKNWYIMEDQLVVPYPPDWSLLWELELYYDPKNPGIYEFSDNLVTINSFGKNLERNDKIISILKKGMSHNIPDRFMKLIQPSTHIRIFSGPILEFTETELLKELRLQRRFSIDLLQIISPHHVILDPFRAERVFIKLQKLGLINDIDFVDFIKRKNDLSEIFFTKAECASLFSYVLLGEGLQAGLSLPPGLMQKFFDSLDDRLIKSAEKQAESVLSNIKTSQPVVFDEEYLLEGEEMIKKLQKAIEKGETVEVYYKKTNQHAAELRHLTPILVEERGIRHYLTAYCHTRRANRIFRIDRMWLRSDFEK